MDKFLLSAPGLIITGIGCLAILWLVGKLLGGSFFFIAAIVIVFLILLIAYLVVRLHDEPLLEKLKKRIGMTHSEKTGGKLNESMHSYGKSGRGPGHPVFPVILLRIV